MVVIQFDTEYGRRGKEDGGNETTWVLQIE